MSCLEECRGQPRPTQCTRRASKWCVPESGSHAPSSHGGRQAIGLTRSREAAKPRREPHGAFESLRCGLDQLVVFEPLMGVDGRTQVRATDASLRASFL